MQSRILTDEQVTRIHNASLAILEKTGVIVPHQDMLNRLEEAGAAVISVSAGSHETQHLSNDIMRMDEDFKRPLFEAVKKELKIPIIVGGGYRNPDSAEKIVADGVADFLGMARSFLADPDWPQKAREGRVEDIRRCVSCGECLYQRGGKFTWPHGWNFL